MKTHFFILCIIFLSLAAVTDTLAATPTPTPTPKKSTNATDSAQPTNINVITDLKERIASRVAQLKLVERRAVIGTATNTTTTQLTISDTKGNTRLIDVDELTRFASPSAKESFGISDITKGTNISILGLYNKQSRRILARFIDVVSLPKSIYGTISHVDKENFTITVTFENNESALVDIERITKTSSYAKDDGVEKFGFSKITEGQKAFVFGFRNSKEKNRVTASRIIILLDVSANATVTQAQKITPTTSSKETIPSTGSGKKITPIN